VQTGAFVGAQMGLVNVSHAIHGVAIGLVSVGPDVRIQPRAWVAIHPELDRPARQSGPTATIGMKFTVRHFYSLVALGLAAEASSCKLGQSCPSRDVRLAPGLALGYGFNLTPRLSLDVDGYYSPEFSPSGSLDADSTVAARATFLYRVHPQVSLFLGGGPRVITPLAAPEESYFGPTFHAGIQVF
jgi:hypothetical protein